MKFLIKSTIYSWRHPLSKPVLLYSRPIFYTNLQMCPTALICSTHFFFPKWYLAKTQKFNCLTLYYYLELELSVKCSQFNYISEILTLHCSDYNLVFIHSSIRYTNNSGTFYFFERENHYYQFSQWTDLSADF